LAPGVDAERRQLADATATAQGQLAALRGRLHAKREPAKAAIFAAHEELISDPDVLEIR
jgi:phosphocarrier protein FPr